MEEIHIKLQGRVQGVGLRRSIRKFSKENNLVGFILNEKDASTTIVAQGKRENINQLLTFLQQNPGFSKITSLNYELLKPKKEFENFEIITQDSFLKDQTKAFLNLYKTVANPKPENIPQHIAIIPDGNRRWAKEKGLTATFGHYKAANYGNMQELFKEAKRLGIKYVSAWGFSTENWKRDPQEVKEILEVLLKAVQKLKEDAPKDKICFKHIGRKDRLPKQLLQEMDELEEQTKDFDELHLQFCFDYGGIDEILRATNKLLKSGQKQITEQDLVNSLDTKDIPPVDLIIRTSGEQRTSGLMPIQAAYAELYFTEKYFPDFDAKELQKAVKEFSNRQRRFGGN